MSNDDVIRRGGGSPQARWADEAGRGGSSRSSGNEEFPLCKACDEPILDPKIVWTGYCTRCKEEIDAMEKDKCRRCHGNGYYYVPNGPDDFDKEVCDCQMKAEEKMDEQIDQGSADADKR